MYRIVIHLQSWQLDNSWKMPCTITFLFPCLMFITGLVCVIVMTDNGNMTWVILSL
jgi:hypothetical protein